MKSGNMVEKRLVLTALTVALIFAWIASAVYAQQRRILDHDIVHNALRLGGNIDWDTPIDTSIWNGGSKCTLFVDAVMKESGLPRPWKNPSWRKACGMMNCLLSDSKDYQVVWKLSDAEAALNPIADAVEYTSMHERWQAFRPQDGDIAIWCNARVEHALILDRYCMFYAVSSGNPKAINTFYYGYISYYTGVAHQIYTQYGPPTVVVRYRNLEHVPDADAPATQMPYRDVGPVMVPGTPEPTPYVPYLRQPRQMLPYVPPSRHRPIPYVKIYSKATDPPGIHSHHARSAVSPDYGVYYYPNGNTHELYGGPQPPP